MTNFNSGQPARAILFFTRSPESDATAKPLSSVVAHKSATSLFESLTAHALRQMQTTGIPVVIAADGPAYNFEHFCLNIKAVVPQRGETFGDRISTAIADTFALGFDEIICIGNDCPSLTDGNIVCAFEELSTHKMVLGESSDGGVYLIGIRRDALNIAQEVMAHCRWETSQVFGDLLADANNSNLTVAFLDLRSDVDTLADLFAACIALPGLAFLKGFTILLSTRFKFINEQQHAIPSGVHTNRLRYQKAPPSPSTLYSA